MRQARLDEAVDARLLVLLREPSPGLVVKVEPKDAPLIVSRPEMAEAGRQAALTIAVRPGLIRGGEYRVQLGLLDSEARVLIPIFVRVEEDR